MPSPITISDFIGDSGLLGNSFAGDSWAAAKTILRAMHGLPLQGASREMFRALAGDRDPPTAPVKEAVIVAGRRFGKDSTASADATFAAAITDHRPYLRVGERATVLCLAVDKIQATRFLRYIRGYFKASPLLKALVSGETGEGLLLDSRHVEIVVTSSNFRQAGRGITAAHITLNEAAFLMSEGSANPAAEIYRSLLPSLSTLPTSRLLTVSSPYTQSGLLFDLVSRHYGRNSDVLVFKGPSRLGNPTLSEARIKRALEEDYESAKAEYLGEWRSSTSGFVPREVVEAAIDRDVAVRPRIDGVQYFAFTDPAGGARNGDSFTLAITHREGDQVVLDLLYERVPPFVTGAVVAEIVALLRSYGLLTVTGDRYAAEWVRGAFAAEGVEYRTSQRDKSAVYVNALPLLTAGRAQLLDIPGGKIVNQFAALERITASGKEKVDHPRGQRDDVCNAICGALVLAAEKPIGSEGIIVTPFIADQKVPDRWSASNYYNDGGIYGGGGSPAAPGFVGWVPKSGGGW